MKQNHKTRRAFARFTIALTAALLFAPFASLVAQGQSVPAVGGKAEAVREGTLRVLSFGLGAPLPSPPVDDLYGRDAVFFADAVKRAASAWSKVETTAISGLDCTPERLRSELERLERAAAASDFVIVHASKHGTTEDKLLRLEGDKKVIDANVLAASLARFPCPSLVTIDACQAGGASALPVASEECLAAG